MSRTVAEYLQDLRHLLVDSDPATVIDALSDAEEHLNAALARSKAENPGLTDEQALAQIIERYGAPAEVAEAYRETESRTSPALAAPSGYYQRSPASRFFGIVYNPRAWGALLYSVISMLTGIVYFTWVTAGLYLSVGLLILIVGLPIAYLFLLSFRGIALVEGRIVEGLLGVRMPRRPIFTDPNLKWWQQLKALIASPRTWLTILYMVLQMPLGILYFTLVVVGIAFALDCIALPITQGIFDHPFIMTGDFTYYVGANLIPLVVLLGFVIFLGVMHMARGLGLLHARLARVLLVGN
jgi:uncharacterized membrane protein